MNRQQNKRPPEDYEPVEVEDAYALRESDSGKALLVSFDSNKRPEWIPQRAIHEDSEVYEKGHHGQLVVWRWVAVEKGMV